MNKILVGSQYFFSCYDDFTGKDIDELKLVETEEFKQFRHIVGQGKCIFLFKKHKNKQDYIDYALSQKLGMVVGKFLVPEFCDAIGLTVEDLPQLRPLIDRLDDKHKYEEIIFDSYLQNGCFTLTDEQRLAAYNNYKESRKPFKEDL